MTLPLRHHCRNPRCRSKLKVPAENPRHAFCCRGCRESYYRSRCVICEGQRPPSPTGVMCRRRKCKNEYRRDPAKFISPWGRKDAPATRIAKTVLLPSTCADSTACFWRGKSGRGWRWTAGEETHRLINREGREVARIQRGGDRWWVARPRSIREPPIESLADAEKRAGHMALWALPLHRVAKRATGSTKNPNALFQCNSAPLNLLGGYRFPNAPALDAELIRAITATEATSIEPPQPETTPVPMVRTVSTAFAIGSSRVDDLDIPQFLQRTAPAPTRLAA
jgi:hypothetical protein